MVTDKKRNLFNNMTVYTQPVQCRGYKMPMPTAVELIAEALTFLAGYLTVNLHSAQLENC